MTENRMVVFLGYDPRRDFIYDTIAGYFQNPSMVKIPPREETGMDLFAVRVSSMLLKDRRFLFVLAPPDATMPFGTVQPLRSIQWEVLQARSVVDDDDLAMLPVMKYDIRRDAFRDYRLIMDNGTEDWTSYRVQPLLPIRVHLLHRKKGRHEYSTEGTIVAAIETYQTILSFTNNSDLESIL